MAVVRSTWFRTDIVYLRFGQLAVEATANSKMIAYNARRRVAKYARDLAPVETGFLRSQIVVTPEGVAALADYSAFQEFGTTRNPPHPYLVPAVEMAKPEFMADFALNLFRGVPSVGEA